MSEPAKHLLESRGIRCPRCHARMTVRDTKARTDGTIKRYRLCPECGQVRVTIESPPHPTNGTT